MKKILFICMALTSTILFAQHNSEPDPRDRLSIRIDSEVWRSGTVTLRSNNVTRILPQGAEVLRDWPVFRDEIDGVFDDMAFIFFENNRYSIRERNLAPITDGRLPRNWITPPDAEKRWTLLHFLETLRSLDRDTVLNYEQEYADWIASRAHFMEAGATWWRGRGINSVTSLIFFDAIVRMGGLGIHRTFVIRNITPFRSGYKITVPLRSVPEEVDGFEVIPNSLRFPQEHRYLDIIFIPDGDFMDVYLDTLDNHFATFASVDATLLTELANLIQTNTVDLSNITSWPQRADGSMDIPPPDGVTLAFRATHTTTARLNVRDNPTTTAPLVTTLELDAEVQILETGYTETIGDITAPWIRILSADGFTGWVFSGFLETVAVESAAVVEYQPAVEVPAVFVPQADDSVEGSTPVLSTWVWFAVVGGVIAICAVIFAVRRKKA